MPQNNQEGNRVVRQGKQKKQKRPKKPLPPALKALKTVGTVILKVFLTIGLVLTITGCICGVTLSIYVIDFINSDANIIDLDHLKVSQTSVLYGKAPDGSYVEVNRIKSGANSIWTDFADIPQDLKDAVVATEDKRFYTHDGVDFRRTFGAFANYVKNKLSPGSGVEYGGSTITQQLIKNINGDIYDRSELVKLQEIIGSMHVDRNYSKDLILEAYLNVIGLHFQINGVGAGAKYYFNKDVSELALDECVALSVISKSPKGYNPIDNPKENQRRRRYAYDEMLKQGYITQEEYDKYYDKELVVAKKQATTEKKGATQSYFVDAAIEEIIADLQKEYNYSYDYAKQQLYTQGYQVYLTMETKTQSVLEDYFEDLSNFYTEAQGKTSANGYRVADHIPDAAYMVIMNYDGDIVAVVGDKGPKEVDMALNRATSPTVTRPAGSTIKPIGIYAPAFEQDLINWSSVFLDEPIMMIEDEKTGEGREYPRNFDLKYTGAINIIDAIKVSKNTIPVYLSNIMTPQASFDFLTQKLKLRGFRASGTYNDVALGSMALGDGGTILSDLTAAFQMFGNGGYYQEHKTYSRVVDANGKVILDNTNDKKERVISAETAYVMNKALRAVVNEEGGSGRAAKLENIEVVGKTGTSNNKKDLVFIGLTPYYVGGIRYGNDDNSELKETGKSQMVVWKEVMEKVHEGLNPAKFELSDEGVIEYEYCVESGKLAHIGCPVRKYGYYKSSYIPDNCNLHNHDGTLNEENRIKSTWEDTKRKFYEEQAKKSNANPTP